MAQIYTTQELARILERERAACLRGDRLNLNATAGFNPVVDPFLNVEGLQKFSAFCDFRESVHQYQRMYQVSGLLWREFCVNGQSILYPEIDEHLIAIPEDLEILALYKDKVLQFWQQTTQGMALYQQVAKHFPPSSVDLSQVEYQSLRSEWAYLHKLEYPGALEVAIQLGWGSPKEALYQKYWPGSGCCFIHAVTPGQIPQGVYY
ncbi:MAG TPA: hypothetical protein V6D19_02060 [Stenomitos sp.]